MGSGISLRAALSRRRLRLGPSLNHPPRSFLRTALCARTTQQTLQEPKGLSEETAKSPKGAKTLTDLGVKLTLPGHLPLFLGCCYICHFCTVSLASSPPQMDGEGRVGGETRNTETSWDPAESGRWGWLGQGLGGPGQGRSSGHTAQGLAGSQGTRGHRPAGVCVGGAAVPPAPG